MPPKNQDHSSNAENGSFDHFGNHHQNENNHDQDHENRADPSDDMYCFLTPEEIQAIHEIENEVENKKRQEQLEQPKNWVHPAEIAPEKSPTAYTKDEEAIPFYFDLMGGTPLKNQKLSPNFLHDHIAPFLLALENLQKVVDEYQGNIHEPIWIKQISQNSPIGFNITGGAEVVKLFEEVVKPWVTEHEIAMFRYQEQKIQADIQKKQAEALEIKSRARRENQEAEKLSVEAIKLRAEVEHQALENEKIRMEIYRSKFELATAILDRMNSSLGESERTGYLVRLLPVLDDLTSSGLTMHRK